MQYKVLKDFKGSPDGRFAVSYAAGDIVELTPSLAEVALNEKWVEPVAVAADPGAKPAKSKKAAVPLAPAGTEEASAKG